MCQAHELKADFGRCQGVRTSKYYNDNLYSDFQCTRSARFEVNGVRYCLRHAEIEALRTLLHP